MKKNEQLDGIEKTLALMQRQMVGLDLKLNKVTNHLDRMAAEKNEAATRMADRLIEMSMVNQGGLRDATTHRNVTKSDTIPEATGDPWAEEQDEWPPKGTDAIMMP